MRIFIKVSFVYLCVLRALSSKSLFVSSNTVYALFAQIAD